MTVTQISVFVQSRPGHLYHVLKRFGSHGVNVRGLSASDTGEYGIVRFIVDKPDEALGFLTEEGYAATATPILCVNLKDEPGELMRVLERLAEHSINVVYCYSLAATCIAVAVHDAEAAESALAKSGFELLDQEAIGHLVPMALFNRN